jgi:hypothetical protein
MVAQDGASPRLNSRAVVALTGLSYLFVGFGFSYLDRRYGSLGLESVLWLIWALLGFGAGALYAHKPTNIGHSQWVALGWVGFLLALFPGFAMFNMLRWTCLTLMIIMGARAVILRTSRDFYLTLTVIFAVSFVVGTHGSADWTLWFYLGPAWTFAGLALAWEHAAGVPIARWTKLLMTLGFAGTSLLLAMMLFFFAPRPPILGFGFLPPGTDTPGMFPHPAGKGTDQSSGGADDASGKSDTAPNGEGSAGQGEAGATQPGELTQQWGALLKNMRQSAEDRSIPQWQRKLMGALLDTAQAFLDLATSRRDEARGNPEEGTPMPESSESLTVTVNWLLILAMLLAGYLLWHRRHRLGLGVALTGSWMLAAYFPAQSMRLSARAMSWCLHLQGHKRGPGESVREHWLAGSQVAPRLARSWLGQALAMYCEMRFGGIPATPQQALAMRQAVQGTCDILMGVAPELAR